MFVAFAAPHSRMTDPRSLAESCWESSESVESSRLVFDSLPVHFHAVPAPSTLDFRDALAVSETLDRAAEIMRQSPLRRGCVIHLPPRGRLLATGDLHDNPIHFNKIMRLAKLGASPDHHVALHELIHGENLINGMDFSHRMLVKIALLVIEHPLQAHPLLANHELAQMTGRGVSKGAGNSVEMFRDALEYVFGDDAETVNDAVKNFIAAMPLALVTEHEGGGIFCAHSLPAPHQMINFDPGVLKRELTEADYAAPHGPAWLMTWGRGHVPEQLRELAATWNVRLFILGHEHVETGMEVRGSGDPATGAPGHIVLNSDHEHGVVLPLDLAEVPIAEEAMLHAIPLSAMSE